MEGGGDTAAPRGARRSREVYDLLAQERKGEEPRPGD